MNSVVLRGICARDWFVITIGSFALFFFFTTAIVLIVIVSPQMIDISLDPTAGYGFYLPFRAVSALCPIAGAVA